MDDLPVLTSPSTVKLDPESHFGALEEKNKFQDLAEPPKICVGLGDGHDVGRKLYPPPDIERMNLSSKTWLLKQA